MKIMVYLILTFRLILFSGCDTCDSLKFYIESAVFETDSGNIVFAFFDDAAPKHVENFKDLVRSGYYNGKTFHRVIPDFVIQAGRDTTIVESMIEPEILKMNFRGALAAARTGNDLNPEMRSDKYEFYVCLDPLPDLDGKYTVFGRTAKGFDTVEKIASAKVDENDRPVSNIFISKCYLEDFFDSEKFEHYRRISERK